MSIVAGTALALAAVVEVLGAAPALAAGSVTVSATDDLDPAGQVITVTGTGFDEEQGIYVSVCVDNGPGQLPTPCLGGVDTTGGTGSSVWVSSNPPPYAEGMTIPYGPGGSFEVTIFATGGDAELGIDCAVVTCSLVTRSDHTATDDRSQDTRTPLTFRAAGAGAPYGAVLPKHLADDDHTGGTEPDRPRISAPTAEAATEGGPPSRRRSGSAAASSPQSPQPHSSSAAGVRRRDLPSDHQQSATPTRADRLSVRAPSRPDSP